MNKVVIDFDSDTSFLLREILSGSLMAMNFSGIPVDPKYYKSIDKLKALSNFSGVMTIELPKGITVGEDYLKSYGINII